jgi:predicted house-cleaning noncanonical NTP pyrophosphatase (MazG superfamily)
MNKLIRDKTAEMLRAEGQNPVTRTVEKDELLPTLLEKLEEMHEEVRLGMKIDEIVDTIEVLITIARHLGISQDSLFEKLSEKREELGSFDTGTLLLDSDGGDQESSLSITSSGSIPARSSEEIKDSIMEVLNHPEAEEGLYFRNFYQLHEEDERRIVPGDEVQILEALKELIEEGKVVADETGSEVVFHLG